MKKLIKFFIKIISLNFIVKGLSVYMPKCFEYFYLADFSGGIPEGSYLFFINFYSFIIFLIIGILLWVLANKISILYIKNNISEKDINVRYIKKITLFIMGFSFIFFAIPEIIRVICEKIILPNSVTIKSIKLIAETIRIIISILLINKSKNI